MDLAQPILEGIIVLAKQYNIQKVILLAPVPVAIIGNAAILTWLSAVEMSRGFLSMSMRSSRHCSCSMSSI